jgi:hypothetical protein
MIGQALGGEGGQEWLHRAIRGSPPLGWNNQIRNDVLLDYYLRVEKIAQQASFEDLTAGVDAAAGTVYDNASAEATFRAGRISGADKFRFYAFGRAAEKAVGYDATLEGGLTNRSSPYVLTAAQTTRFVPRADIGFALDEGKFAAEAVWSDIGKEFSTGLSQRWIEISGLVRF